ncbi:hypothetical protein SeMB42_g02433 [Synchytrium endobioticum]|uniref:SH3 domain-containing protein n=1 Tax=Synchytrium endobioticum TaxID=286115 RepID=A0A507CSM0_9FUNG|nr:hypothetical protein SeLEV6574_g05743 [Synchytrium endobioticum]TPX49894.1 hypothetical protein SeMB42_g02433 [Synchytrium endobioticum]
MVNSPIPQELGQQCKVAAKIIAKFVRPDSSFGPDQYIPPTILANAKGVAILTVIKAGFLFSGRAGAGLVVARLPDGSWSAPCGIGVAGAGAGGQIGVEITDFVFILNTEESVKAFSHTGNLTLGGNISIAAGPLGRSAEAAGSALHLAAIYSYSKTKGLFAGVSIEGSVILERKETNAEFYNRKVSAKEILTGHVPPPPQANDLYKALNTKIEAGMKIADEKQRAQARQIAESERQRYLMIEAANAEGTYGQDPYATYRASSAANPFGAQAQRAASVEYPRNHWSNNSNQNNPPRPYGSMASKPGTMPSAATRRAIGNGAEFATALYDFDGEQEGDLYFRTGDTITIVNKTGDTNSWWRGRVGQREGNFPANYVQLQ